MLSQIEMDDKLKMILVLFFFLFLSGCHAAKDCGLDLNP